MRILLRLERLNVDTITILYSTDKKLEYVALNVCGVKKTLFDALKYVTARG